MKGQQVAGIPERTGTLVFSFLVVLLSFALTILLILRNELSENAMNMILAFWLGSGLGPVVNFWVGTSVGGRMRANGTPQNEAVKERSGEG